MLLKKISPEITRKVQHFFLLLIKERERKREKALQCTFRDISRLIAEK